MAPLAALQTKQATRVMVPAHSPTTHPPTLPPTHTPTPPQSASAPAPADTCTPASGAHAPPASHQPHAGARDWRPTHPLPAPHPPPAITAPWLPQPALRPPTPPLAPPQPHAPDTRHVYDTCQMRRCVLSPHTTAGVCQSTCITWKCSTTGHSYPFVTHVRFLSFSLPQAMRGVRQRSHQDFSKRQTHIKQRAPPKKRKYSVLSIKDDRRKVQGL